MVQPIISSIRYRKADFEDIEFVHYKGRKGEAIIALVGDGVGPFYSPSKPQRILSYMGDKMHAAQVVGHIVTETSHCTPSTHTLRDTLVLANQRVAIQLRTFGFSLEDAADLPGLDVAGVQIRSDTIEVAQCGDCMALWQRTDGSYGGTRNQAWQFEAELEPVSDRLREAGISGGALWDHPDWEAAFRAGRAKHCNQPGGCATINGQAAFADGLFTQELERAKIRRILLITDGMVPYQSLEDELRLAEKLFKHCDAGGLKAILDAKGVEKITEATGILIEF